MDDADAWQWIHAMCDELAVSECGSSRSVRMAAPPKLVPHPALRFACGGRRASRDHEGRVWSDDSVLGFLCAAMAAPSLTDE